MIAGGYRLIASVAFTLVIGTVTIGVTQEAKPARLVVLSRSPANIQGLREMLQERGHVEGRTYTIELRHAGGSTARLRELAMEVARSKPDIIYAPHGVAATAAKAATSSIPIVFFSVDPIADGLVTSLARPDGNATGLTSPQVDLSAKRMQLLREAFPALKRVAVLYLPDSRRSLALLDGYKNGAAASKMEVLPVAVHTDIDLAAALDTAMRQRAEAITHISTPFFSTHRAQLIAFSAKQRIPAISDNADFVRAGGLMSYGSDARFIARQAAVYVDKILKGAKPADLPIDQPLRFELAINVKTAKALGLTLAQSVMSRADQIIQ